MNDELTRIIKEYADLENNLTEQERRHLHEGRPVPGRAMPRLLILVIAGSNGQFRRWCQENGFSNSTDRVKYVQELDDLVGYPGRDVEIVFCGSWSEKAKRLGSGIRQLTDEGALTSYEN